MCHSAARISALCSRRSAFLLRIDAAQPQEISERRCAAEGCFAEKSTPYKIIDSENFIKVSQNPNKVARDTQGLPTVPHNDFGGLNFKGLASKYLLLMTLPPADDEKMKKNRTSGTPTSEKTSDSASSSKVCHTKVKLKISETNFCKSYGPASE